MTPETYRFANGVTLFRHMLLDVQLARYQEPGNPNLHEPEEEAWLERLLERCGTDEPIFIDIGAGVGYYSILVKQRHPLARVLAIEPLSAHADAIVAHAALNGLDDGAIEVRTNAISSHAGMSEFVPLHYGSHLKSAGKTGRPGATINVPTITLADLMADVGAAADVVKLDIQGSELEVLAAVPDLLASGRIRSLIVGTHGPALFEGVRTLLAARYDLLHADPAPAFQPDGLIVACHRSPAPR
ncbi:FkbM family methyltransferase [Azospirillum halopraeferens]|uniref:FkbM family methyltransferase n=1 Tax=Azospirillum halopraeferens TaxID=34010 RepID=UPI0004288D2C|nr:FkbM family methyltransferase [Azospirillum halopraeferens]